MSEKDEGILEFVDQFYFCKYFQNKINYGYVIKYSACIYYQSNVIYYLNLKLKRYYCDIKFVFWI